METRRWRVAADHSSPEASRVYTLEALGCCCNLCYCDAANLRAKMDCTLSLVDEWWFASRGAVANAPGEAGYSRPLQPSRHTCKYLHCSPRFYSTTPQEGTTICHLNVLQFSIAICLQTLPLWFVSTDAC